MIAAREAKMLKCNVRHHRPSDAVQNAVLVTGNTRHRIHLDPIDSNGGKHPRMVPVDGFIVHLQLT